MGACERSVVLASLVSSKVVWQTFLVCASTLLSLLAQMTVHVERMTTAAAWALAFTVDNVPLLKIATHPATHGSM